MFTLHGHISVKVNNFFVIHTLQILLWLSHLPWSWDFFSSLATKAAEYTPFRVFLGFLSKRCNMGTYKLEYTAHTLLIRPKQIT